MTASTSPARKLQVSLAGLIMGFACLLGSIVSPASQSAEPDWLDQEVRAKYEALWAKGEETAAVKLLLDYAEKNHGENTPKTVRLTHAYGYLLLQDSSYRKAVKVLKTALKRSIAAYGELGGEAFDINLNLGYAYAGWRNDPTASTKYFDRALEILRKRGEHESIHYVTTLVNIVFSLMEGGGLEGSSTSYIKILGEHLRIFEFEYNNHFHLARKYILEAADVSRKLESQDEYLSAKIAIIQAKLNVLETADLEEVPVGVDGYISPKKASTNYNREEERLMMAIEKLSLDVETNQIFLDAANKGLMEIAWLEKDRQRLVAMCENGTLNSSSEYSNDRLYEIMVDGTVFALEIGIKVSTDIFEPYKAEESLESNRRQKHRVKRPYFIPVCIDRHLMAALINAPRVTMEELPPDS